MKGGVHHDFTVGTESETCKILCGFVKYLCCPRPPWNPAAGRRVESVSRREFVMTVMATVAAYYIVKCLDWFVTLIMGN